MRREPFFYSLVRLLLAACLVFFLAMLWWSSVRVEQELIEVKGALQTLDKKWGAAPVRAEGVIAPSQSTIKRLWDPNLPNLLHEDPYYTSTLPKQLGPAFKPLGKRRDATIGKPDNLHPFNNWLQVATWNSMCTVALARSQFGVYETFCPDMALKIEERAPGEYWVHLKENVFWQPLQKEWFPADFELNEIFLEKHPVTADDYKFYFDALMNPAVAEPGAVALRTYLGDIAEVKVIDPLTLVVKWKEPKYVSKLLTGSLRPLPCFVYQYFADGKKIIEDDSDPATYRKNALFALNFSKHWAKNIIVSCGAWLFNGMSDRAIRFRRNPEHYFPFDVLVEEMEVELRSSLDAIWQDFKEKKFDTHVLRPEQLLELDHFLQSASYQRQEGEGAAIQRLDYIGRTFQYIGWNQARPLFQSKKVRQALTMGIDRERIIRQTLHGLGIVAHGQFHPSSPSSNPAIQPWPYDPQKAKRYLEEEGWYDRDGDGTIDKVIDGKVIPFRFSLTYFVKNPTAKAIVEYIAQALSVLGIQVELNGVDLADLSKIFDDKDFDALFLAWALGSPPEDPRQLWYSKEAEKKGSSNMVGFRNKEADEIIEQLDFEADKQKRLELYHRFDAILHEEQPYTFLYTPKESLLWRAWLQNVFIPAEHQDIIPGADVSEPDLNVVWFRRT